MPGMSGPELAEAAGNLRPELKIVFTSGVVEEHDVPSHISFVPKPLLLDAIATAVAIENRERG